MDSKVTTATVQATVLNALSGVFAQGILTYRKRMAGVSGANVSSHDRAKGRRQSLKDKPSPSPSQDAVTCGKLNIGNTAAKFFLDQGLGAPVNTLLFICLMGQMSLQGYDGVLSSVIRDFWPMLSAGYRVWPLVCLLNLVIVPFDYRQLVGSIAGLGWGVYLSLSQIK